MFRFPVRALRLLVHLGYGLLLAAAIKLDHGGRLNRDRLACVWFRGLLATLSLRLRVNGAPVRGGRVTVANHVSWLDIPVIGSCEATRFVAKAEVRDWPVAGWLANAAGTFYIHRGKHGTKPLLGRLAPHLETGGSITIFPEGTTTDGTDVLPFHPRLLAAAIESGCPVQPVAVCYRRTADGRNLAPFIGDDDLVSHVIRLLKAPSIEVEVTWLAPISPESRDRDELAKLAFGGIQQTLYFANAAEQLDAADGSASLVA